MGIAIFYHTCQLPGWADLFDEQINTLVNTGLLDAAEFVWVGINGDTVPAFRHPKVQYHFNPRPYLEETDTLTALQDFAYANTDYKILYFHMKGAKSLLAPAWPSHERHGVEYMRNWRLYLEHYVLTLWREHVELLDYHDAAGPNLRQHPRLHYSGGMWWAKDSLIRTLDPELLRTPNRWDREMWIGSGKGDYVCTHESHQDHYNNPYPKELWTEIPEELFERETND